MFRACLILSMLLGAVIAHSQIISAGDEHAAIICHDNLSLSGHNDKGELGDGSWIDKHSFLPLSSVTNIVNVSAGYAHTLILQADSTVWAFGDNSYGQLGNGSTISSNVPIQVSGLTGIVGIASGRGFSLFLKRDGTVWACGGDGVGELGIGVANSLPNKLPLQTNIDSVKAIAAVGGHSIFLRADSTVWTCGNNPFGQLGWAPGSMNAFPVPTKIPGLTGIVAVASGDLHSLFLRADGTVWGCGYNNYGELGDGTQNSSAIPVQANPVWNGKIIAISGGGHYSLFIKQDSSAWGCGLNVVGQLGDGTMTDRWNAVPVSISKVVKISAGGYHSMFVKPDSSIWACGDNTYGQIGDGTTTKRLVPVHVPTICDQTSSTELWGTNLQMSIYPNPSKGEFFVEVPNDYSSVMICVYDITGRAVLQQKFETEKLKITLPNGFYVVEISSEGKALRRKVVVQE